MENGDIATVFTVGLVLVLVTIVTVSKRSVNPVLNMYSNNINRKIPLK